ncbi:Mob1/phocein family protein [Toxoplasma gondii TgCatPRC2]|uniref:Mob1/phocein family protein n=1 Tax=Toxoplasma gondii TgCatPRC2 TaxID=1130821 RepID=A0A151H875_TOXGO|nr:Mob1/phocein family protein [Toxoplasma gondii TgCatPRC2]
MHERKAKSIEHAGRFGKNDEAYPATSLSEAPGLPRKSQKPRRKTAPVFSSTVSFSLSSRHFRRNCPAILKPQNSPGPLFASAMCCSPGASPCRVSSGVSSTRREQESHQMESAAEHRGRIHASGTSAIRTEEERHEPSASFSPTRPRNSASPAMDSFAVSRSSSMSLSVLPRSASLSNPSSSPGSSEPPGNELPLENTPLSANFASQIPPPVSPVTPPVSSRRFSGVHIAADKEEPATLPPLEAGTPVSKSDLCPSSSYSLQGDNRPYTAACTARSCSLSSSPSRNAPNSRDMPGEAAPSWSIQARGKCLVSPRTRPERARVSLICDGTYPPTPPPSDSPAVQRSSRLSPSCQNPLLLEHLRLPPHCLEITRRALEATLHNRQLSLAVAAPLLVDENEWIASQLAICLADLQLLLSCIWDACTCPVMAAGSIFFLVLKSAAVPERHLRGRGPSLLSESHGRETFFRSGTQCPVSDCPRALDDALVTREMYRSELVKKPIYRATHLNRGFISPRAHNCMDGRSMRWGGQHLRDTERGECDQRKREHKLHEQTKRLEADISSALNFYRNSAGGTSTRPLVPSELQLHTARNGEGSMDHNVYLNSREELKFSCQQRRSLQVKDATGRTPQETHSTSASPESSRPLRIQSARQYMETVLAWCVAQIHHGDLLRRPPKASGKPPGYSILSSGQGSTVVPDIPTSLPESGSHPANKCSDEEPETLEGNAAIARKFGEEKTRGIGKTGVEKGKASRKAGEIDNPGLVRGWTRRESLLNQNSGTRVADVRQRGSFWLAKRFHVVDECEGEASQRERDVQRFRKVSCRMCRRLFRCYAHIYHFHLDLLCTYDVLAHVNRCFKFFLFFAHKFQLLADADTEPLRNLVTHILTSNSRVQESLDPESKQSSLPSPASPPFSQSFFLKDPETELRGSYRAADSDLHLSENLTSLNPPSDSPASSLKAPEPWNYVSPSEDASATPPVLSPDSPAESSSASTFSSTDLVSPPEAPISPSDAQERPETDDLSFPLASHAFGEPPPTRDGMAASSPLCARSPPLSSSSSFVFRSSTECTARCETSSDSQGNLSKNSDVFPLPLLSSQVSLETSRDEDSSHRYCSSCASRPRPPTSVSFSTAIAPSGTVGETGEPDADERGEGKGNATDTESAKESERKEQESEEKNKEQGALTVQIRQEAETPDADTESEDALEDAGEPRTDKMDRDLMTALACDLRKSEHQRRQVEVLTGEYQRYALETEDVDLPGFPDSLNIELHRVDSYEELPLLPEPENEEEESEEAEAEKGVQRRFPEDRDEEENTEKRVQGERAGDIEEHDCVKKQEWQNRGGPRQERHRKADELVCARLVGEDVPISKPVHEKKRDEKWKKRVKPILPSLALQAPELNEIQMALREAKALKPTTPQSERDRGQRRTTRMLLESLLLQQQPYT